MGRRAIEAEYFDEGAIWIWRNPENNSLQITGRGRIGLGRLVDFANRTRIIEEGPKEVALEVLRQAETTIKGIWSHGAALTTHGDLLVQDLRNLNLSPDQMTRLRGELLIEADPSEVSGVIKPTPDGAKRSPGKIFLIAPNAGLRMGYLVTSGGVAHLSIYPAEQQVRGLGTIEKTQTLLVRAMYWEKEAMPVIASQTIQRQTMIEIANAGLGVVPSR